MILFMVLAASMALAVAAVVAVPLLRGAGPAQAPVAPAAPWAALGAGALLLVGAAIIYVSLSNWHWPAAPAADSPQSMVASLARRLEKQPDDPAGWLLLGRSYSVLEQYPLALRAYERANRLADGKNAEALLGVAESLALQNEAEIDGRAGKLFEQALALDPNSGKALFYSAVVAARRGDLALARERFVRLLAMNPPENLRPMLEKQIQSIDQRLAGGAVAGTVPAASATAADAAGAVVRVNVRLAPAIQARIGDSPLFVLVRDPAAPGPPLAAKRLVSHFPQAVELTPRDSMIPGHSFHKGQKVEVVARISRSGGPIAQTGDPFGQLEYAVGTDGVRDVVIDRVSPERRTRTVISLRHLLEFEAPPSLWSLYPRLLTSRKPARMAAGLEVPRIEAVLKQCTTDVRHLERFRALTAEPDSDWLPLAYPHVLASRLHLAVLTAGAFPVRLMGLIHIRNIITQQRRIRASESFELRCGVDGHRESAAGQEIDLETVVLIDGTQVWHETSTFLARGSSRRALARSRGSEQEPLQPFGSLKTANFRAEPDIGRRYALVSGDCNLIHLSVLTARLFGFRRAIAHGMWSLARCATEIGANSVVGFAELDVTFRAAIFLPAALTLQSSSAANGCQFALQGSHSDRPYLTGRLRVPP